MKVEALFVYTKALLYLISCALNGNAPDKSEIESFDLERIYKLAKFNSIESVSYAALENYLTANPNSDLNLSEETLKKFKEEFIKHNLKIVTMSDLGLK